jgi:hypothetical protein
VSSISGASLAVADRAHIMAAMADFGGKPIDQWLDPTKLGYDGALPKHWPQFQAMGAPQIIRVLAASAPNHCMDGWSYVSRSLSSLLAGDPHAARHLAYYAQLRAALSLLANLGVGVVDGINFAVDASGAVRPLDPGQTDLHLQHEGPAHTASYGTHWRLGAQIPFLLPLFYALFEFEAPRWTTFFELSGRATRQKPSHRA